ncbi:hypothetical protein [Shewanella sp. TB4-MNA-CIBAN-0142]|jgi:hypothetical protein|uniref:hypothetical protein n=1 Tax=Shewanella sp. TB4-MNA-CIBAN-0142 TaxID=3140464 RepID=UPI003332F3B3
MISKLLIAIFVSALIAGCQSTSNKAPVSQDEPSNSSLLEVPFDSYFSIETDPQNLSSTLEGTQHKIWREAAYKELRSELNEGEIVVFKNVEAKRKALGGGYFYLGDIYSLDGQNLFDKKYTLSDVGVINFKPYELNKSVNQKVVITTRGTIYHGSVTDEKNDYTSVYWKSTGGSLPNAIPVRDYKKSHKIAEQYKTGLQVSCNGGAVYIGFNKNDYIYAANGEPITVKVYYPYSKGKDYLSKSVGFTGVFLKVDNHIERIILEEDAIKLLAYSKYNRGFTEITAYNNGLAEAYSRVKYSCKM